ncbi:MAG: DUF2442 domain-containing protein [Clostridia bacterium]|nr:DUF2442 domain-containing protein [Clostridia bacterium]
MACRAKKKFYHHTVKDVCALPGYRLRVVFFKGVTKTYDMNGLIGTWPLYRPLKDTNLFVGVRADPGGFGISQNGDIDLSCTELWDNGVEIESC